MKRLLFLLSVCLSLPVIAQHRFRVVTWNVENLFDARHDTLKEDEEFLPESERQWTWGRYWRKVEDVGRIVMGIGNDRPPSLIALQEVENDSVMISLCRRGNLHALGYKYVMTDSPDKRGIDVALMYQPFDFRLMGYESRRIPSEQFGLRPTRDLLHAWGRVPTGDTLHVIVCHLPSRAGANRESKRNRKLATECLKQLCDSVFNLSPHCNLLVMGDFNSTLSSLRQLTKDKSLISLTPDSRRPMSGTYRFQGNWSWIDHMLVSPSLLDKVTSEPTLYSPEWIRRCVADGTWYPRRTYLGTVYSGGVSDHLPFFVDFVWHE